MEESLECLVERVKQEVFSPSADIYSFLPSSAYETAWVAMIPNPERRRRPMFPNCLIWMLRNQNDGGSWGELDLTIDCLTATLACTIALKTWNVGYINIEKGLKFLHAHTEKVLMKHHGGIPRWFAIIFPGMLELAKAKGLEVFPQGYTGVVEDIFNEREKIFKMEETSCGGHHLPLSLYLEALPAIYRGKHEDILKHKREDGSLFHSPSATACAFMITGDGDCKEYLEAIVQRCGHGVPPAYPVDQDLIKLCMMDHLMRLGCGEHFTKEIGDAMDHIYWNWVTEELQPSNVHDLPLQIFKDFLTFQLLRKHGHRISPERCCWFMRDPQMLLHIEENYQDFLGAMYAVYIATHLMFPEEPEFENAKTFSKKILQKGLPGKDVKDHPSALSDLQEEIEHELKHLWLARMDHLEHRTYIERTKGYNIWIGKSSSCRLTCSDDIIQLAIKNFMTRQSVYRTELEELKRWSKDTGLANMGFGRENTSYCYFVAATPIFLLLDSEVRKIIAKSAILVTVADDFFDEHGSLDELQCLTQAVQRWEGEGLSGHSKVIFETLDDLVCDIALKIFNQQGHDMKTLLQDFWREAFDVWLTESEWSRIKHAPSIDEYLRVGTLSIAIQAMYLPACYLASPKHPQSSSGTRYSKITKLLMLSTRLLNDIQSYEKEMKDGKLNMVPLYLKANPEANIEDSIAYIQNKLERFEKQLLEITMVDSNAEVPKEWKQIHLCALKGFQMLFNTFNAFDSPTALLQDITMAFYEPLAMDSQRMLLPTFVLNAHESIKENTGRLMDDSSKKEVKTQGQLQGMNGKIVYNSRAIPSKIKQSLYYVRPKCLLGLRRPSSCMFLAVPPNSPSPLLKM
ncbi:S-linalool synthase-like isoform X1 [Phoenix dactylifera]|uniref:S-linalool synthase-like isoform X1 n=1 Tax=Phoenix dactylifera TaxID=42345 RepID=A0A8B9ACP9_PHODC|nr:S-linalool synthase-like isoform X1 [Phoenix dactylifera]